jgi:lysophospholipase L1-like esterase
MPLPFDDNFDDGASEGWAIVNETPSVATWGVVSGELSLSTVVESTSSFEESYHLGTYAWLTAGTALADYSMSVDARRVNTDRPESFGILFRYRDADNFYRFTLNSRYGFARLEKREAGLYYTLGASAIADNPATGVTINVDVEGPEIRVRLDGRKLFASTDSAHLVGSVGLFAQAQSAFDNVSITPVNPAPDVSLSSPVADSVSPTGDVTAAAIVRGLPAGGSLDLAVPGRPAVSLIGPPWQTTFAALPAGPTTVTATMRDSSNTPVAQHVVDIAVNGDYVLAVGDSITNGIGDSFSSDNDDARRVLASRAYASTLAALMEALPPTEVVVFNEGIGGDRTDETDILRLQSIVERHADAKSALVQLGTNDANSDRSVTAFSGNLQSIVSRLNAEGISVYVAKLPPFVGPTYTLESVQNSRVLQYNGAIDANITDALPGPDFWAFFAPDDDNDGVADRLRTDLFDDPIHPTALGHSVMATMWYNALLGDATGTAITPFVLESISRPAYKQNLVEAGDEYLVDSAAVVTDIPAALADAVWIMTAQSDAASSEPSFLSVETDSTATVYVAYDNDAVSLPDWLNPLESTYSETGLTLRTSVSDYRIFSRPLAPGTAVFGGNLAAGADGAADMYVIAVRLGN